MSIGLHRMDAGEAGDVVRYICRCFAAEAEGATKWMDAAGHENFRVVRDDGRIVSSLLRIPMGQYFGGKSVSLMGIAGVAVPPENRGRGYARAMMRLGMEEAQREGFALGGLYASTQTLYRQIGFEQAAHRHRVEVPLASLGVVERAGDVQVLSAAQMDEIRACYNEFARIWNGPLDRGSYIWARIQSTRGVTYEPFGVRGKNGTLDGYVYLALTRKADTGRQSIEISDIAFTNARAGRRLLGMLADHASMADEFVFHGGPTHPLMMLMPQQRYRTMFKDMHMTRVLDFKRAVEGRGYAPSARAKFELEIGDDLIAENAGRWVVEVEGGSARVVRGGSGAIKTDIRGFAAVFGGYVTPMQAKLAGWAEGNERDLQNADVFGAGVPWMSDMY
ncbi:MAG TPA: GNAT family N-acetyltransferase [Phycisphaerales bacterium]|nr:GNAT family N-acetyltransferase [Phycisphaerales bacterium]